MVTNGLDRSPEALDAICATASITPPMHDDRASQGARTRCDGTEHVGMSENICVPH